MAILHAEADVSTAIWGLSFFSLAALPVWHHENGSKEMLTNPFTRFLFGGCLAKQFWLESNESFESSFELNGGSETQGEKYLFIPDYQGFFLYFNNYTLIIIVCHNFSNLLFLFNFIIFLKILLNYYCLNLFILCFFYILYR